MKNNNDKNKVSFFERIFAVVIGVLILAVIIVSLLTSVPIFTVTPITIALFVLLIIVAGMFVFDYISFGNILSLKKDNKELRDENQSYRLMILNNNIFKNQNSFNVNINSAEKDEIEEKQKVEETVIGVRETATKSKYMTIAEKQALKQKALQTFIHDRKIAAVVEINRVFSKNIDEIDPVMSRSRVFDAYFQDNGREFFVDTIISNTYSGIYQYYLYIELSQLYHYNIKMNKKAKLLLLLPKIESQDSELSGRQEDGISMIKKLFSPAINNGLLEIISLNMPRNK